MVEDFRMILRAAGCVVVLLASIAYGQSTALENLGGSGEARTVWSKEAGRLESGGSVAVVVSVIVEDFRQPGTRLRGVRFDLSDRGWNRSVYVDEGKLPGLKRILEQLNRDIELVGLRSTFIGSCEFRDHSDSYPIHFDYYTGAEAPGLRILPLMMLPDRKPADLAMVLGKAIEDLKQQ